VAHLPAIAPHATAQEALESLAQAGWAMIGVGDWSWVLGDPSGAWAARVTPFDPACEMYARACLDGPINRWLPRVARMLPLARDGYIVVMERLQPADEAQASAFCVALGIANDSGWTPPSDAPLADFLGPDLDALRSRVRALLDDGARRYRLWGGSDIRPGNIMVDPEGSLKLIDPIFIRGRAVVEAIEGGRRDHLADFSRPQLEDFLTIPVFPPGSQTDAIRARLASLFEPPGDDIARR
jgi:hypothetical protein